MKFWNTDYPEFLRYLYAQHPGLERQPYEHQMRVRNESLFGITNFYCSNLRKLGHEAWEIEAPGNESPSEPKLLFLTPCSSAHVFCINSLLVEDRLRFPPTLDWFRSKGVPAELNRLAFEPRVLSHLKKNGERKIARKSRHVPRRPHE